jgi:hypothetical protein
MDTELAHASSAFTHALRSPSPTLAPSAANAPHPARRDDASVWSGARRVAFRLAFVYFALYIPSFPIAWWPRPLGEPLLVRLSSPVVPNGAQRWILAHVLHISPPWASGFAGAGDSPVGWANLFGFLAVAVVGSASWTLADRSRTHYTTLHHILRTAIRLTLGVVMLWYGVTKFAGVQFPGPSLGRLAQPVGELTPMALLWTTMGHSPGYARFAGGVEILGALLLFHRRTTTLGALILVGATANVLALNLAYDVGQKLFSAHLLVMAGLLVAPDAPRLAAVLLLDRAPPSHDARPLPRPGRWAALARGAWAAYLAYVVVDFGRFVLVQPPRVPLDGGGMVGLFDIVAISTHARAPAASVDPPDDWRRLVIERDGFATLTLADGGVRRLHLSRDPVGDRVILVSAPHDIELPRALTATAYTGVLRTFDVARARTIDTLAVTGAGTDRLRVVGRSGGDSVDVLFRRRSASSLPLLGWRRHAVWRDTFWPLL